MALKPGDKAPDFILTDQFGKVFNLYQTLDSGKNVVLFFYPKDFTSGCTAEVCEFRDRYSEFKSANTEVVGISNDSIDSHLSFSSAYHLPYLLLSDEANIISKLYGVGRKFLLVKSRITYVIGSNGIILEAFENNINPYSHIRMALSKING